MNGTTVGTISHTVVTLAAILAATIIALHSDGSSTPVVVTALAASIGGNSLVTASSNLALLRRGA